MTGTWRRLSPFGVAVEGLQIASADTRDADAVRSRLAAHRVVVLKHQTGDDEAFVLFLKRLGPLTFTEAEVPVAGAPDLNIVSNVGRRVPPRSVFHTDTSYVPRPPAIGALRAIVLPTAGGSTLFSDQVGAAAALPGAIAHWLRGQTLLHAIDGSDGTRRAARHPVLTLHPATGAVALFLSTPERCSALSGVDAFTSARIVRLLYDRSRRAAGLYCHAWEPGDIVLWDNRATMHRADHADVIGDRILHRGLVLGNAPVAA